MEGELIDEGLNNDPGQSLVVHDERRILKVYCEGDKKWAWAMEPMKPAGRARKRYGPLRPLGHLTQVGLVIGCQ